MVLNIVQYVTVFQETGTRYCCDMQSQLYHWYELIDRYKPIQANIDYYFNFLTQNANHADMIHLPIIITYTAVMISFSPGRYRSNTNIRTHTCDSSFDMQIEIWISNIKRKWSRF